MFEIPNFKDGEPLYAEQLTALAHLPFACLRTLLQLLDSGFGLFCLPEDEPGTANLLKGDTLVTVRMLLPDGRPLVVDRLQLPADLGEDGGEIRLDGDRLLIAGGEASLMSIGAQKEVWDAAQKLAESLEHLEKSVAGSAGFKTLVPVFGLVLARARRQLRRGRSLVDDVTEALDDCFECSRLIARDLEIQALGSRTISDLCDFLRSYRRLASRLDGVIRGPGELSELIALEERPEGDFTRYIYDVAGRTRLRIDCTQENGLLYTQDDGRQPTTNYQHLRSTQDFQAEGRQYLHVKVKNATGLAVYAD